jgi:hypothetical protein
MIKMHMLRVVVGGTDIFQMEALILFIIACWFNPNQMLNIFRQSTQSHT